tara:strand:+ start:3347 stop:4390 length:1044 start_codon:yes stop_codon:yes gene_type:complete
MHPRKDTCVTYWHLHKLDLESRSVEYLGFDTPDILYQAAFWDDNLEPVASHCRTRPLNDILAEVDRSTAPAPAGFIFHNGYCGSTLMSRLLTQPGRTLTVREPQAITHLADARRNLPEQWTAGLGHAPVLRQLLAEAAHPIQPGERAIMKPSNTDTILAPDIFAALPEARALFMYSDLEDFLLSALSNGTTGVERIRRMLLLFCFEVQALSQMGPQVLLKMTDLQAATLVWRVQMERMDRLLAAFPGKIRTLRIDDFLDAPLEAARHTARFLQPDSGLTLDESSLQGTMGRHAKHPSRPYNPQARREERQKLRRERQRDLDPVLEWASGVSVTGPVSLDDTSTLLSA